MTINHHKKCGRCGKRITEFEARHNKIDEDIYLCSECTDEDMDKDYLTVFYDGDA